ncbi:hypothetical protein RHMOL_Rhmol04G0152400 [Rhododendron molle]|uniref:Uncharacterized protein n=1 Tax=Rhododendron molle TaxID=49168 RepID=A0ACC0P1X1_RHOML|nr:hypothetical protein RHMOL_Rhmol04G0152400 [Rhododendron molle]
MVDGRSFLAVANIDGWPANTVAIEKGNKRRDCDVEVKVNSTQSITRYLGRCLVGNMENGVKALQSAMELQRWAQKLWKVTAGVQLSELGGASFLFTLPSAEEAQCAFKGLPLQFWDFEVFKEIGNFCAGFLDVDEETRERKHLCWARIAVLAVPMEIPASTKIPASDEDSANRCGQRRGREWSWVKKGDMGGGTSYRAEDSAIEAEAGMFDMNRTVWSNIYRQPSGKDGPVGVGKSYHVPSDNSEVCMIYKRTSPSLPSPFLFSDEGLVDMSTEGDTLLVVDDFTGGTEFGGKGQLVGGIGEKVVEGQHCDRGGLFSIGGECKGRVVRGCEVGVGEGSVCSRGLELVPYARLVERDVTGGSF